MLVGHLDRTPQSQLTAEARVGLVLVALASAYLVLWEYR